MQIPNKHGAKAGAKSVKFSLFLHLTGAKAITFCTQKVGFAPPKVYFALKWPCFCTEKIRKKKTERKDVLKVAKVPEIAAYFGIGLNLGSAAELGPADALGALFCESRFGYRNMRIAGLRRFARIACTI